MFLVQEFKTHRSNGFVDELPRSLISLRSTRDDSSRNVIVSVGAAFGRTDTDSIKTKNVILSEAKNPVKYCLGHVL